MAKRNTDFGLPEKGEFDRDNLEEKLIGKVVCVTYANIFNLDGKLIYYKSGDIAILEPYIMLIAGEPHLIKEKATLEQPTSILVYPEKTVKSFLEKRLKPALERSKAEQAKLSQNKQK